MNKHSSSYLSSLPDPVRAALEFDRSQWATGSVHEDTFYSVDASSASVEAGTLLKLEQTVDTSLFNIPPATALSRFVYQSKTLNGSLVPVSAYILWPHTPRTSPDGYQIVAWSHATSGTAPECAPSHIKNLWQHFLAPYQIALQGYVVIATDYAGLGVSKNAHGDRIVHQYLACPAHANDVFYSVQAAQSAFSELSASFVIVGHSQGGGSAWAAAQRQVHTPVPGYLGAVAISPVTTVLDEPEPIRSIMGVAMASGIESVFPGFERSEMLTTEGLQRKGLAEKLDACMATSLAILTGVPAALTTPNWVENRFVQEYQTLTSTGCKEISGPLLVIHGEADTKLAFSLTAATIQKTAEQFPNAQIEFLQVPGVSHDASLTSTQWIWLDWVAQRFAGVEQASGLKERKIKVARPANTYQADSNWWIAPATEFYHTPGV
jgi:pimeloyl-ACP methyl ester carboxylesterase